jgi:hypothetical protein
VQPQHFAREQSPIVSSHPRIRVYCVRPRALVWLLPLTAGDYLLWNWSVGGSHDVLALISGMTLLPLVAVSLGLLGLAGIRLLARALRKSSTMARLVHPAHTHQEAHRPENGVPSAENGARGASQSPSSARKLAA